MIIPAGRAVGLWTPRPVDLGRTGRLAGIGVAQVRCDAAVLSLELADRVEGVLQAGDRRVQSSAGNEQQREAGTPLLIVAANGTLFVQRHGACSFPILLPKPTPPPSHSPP